MSVLVILTKSLVFLWCVLTWLCGVRRRQVCVVEAHESVCDGVVNTEEPQISVAVQNPSKLRRRNVLMISPDGEGQSESTLLNLISCSPEWILTPITQGQEVQQTCSNPTQVVQARRLTAPVVEGVENGLSRYTSTLYTSWFIHTGLVTKHGFNLFSWEARIGNSDRRAIQFHCWTSYLNYLVTFLGQDTKF